MFSVVDEISSGIKTNTNLNAAYSTLTPYEVGTTDLAVLKVRANVAGAQDRSAATTNNVMCLSCHRAHASASSRCSGSSTGTSS